MPQEEDEENDADDLATPQALTMQQLERSTAKLVQQFQVRYHAQGPFSADDLQAGPDLDHGVMYRHMLPALLSLNQRCCAWRRQSLNAASS